MIYLHNAVLLDYLFLSLHVLLLQSSGWFGRSPFPSGGKTQFSASHNLSRPSSTATCTVSSSQPELYLYLHLPFFSMCKCVGYCECEWGYIVATLDLTIVGKLLVDVTYLLFCYAHCFYLAYWQGNAVLFHSSWDLTHIELFVESLHALHCYNWTWAMYLNVLPHVLLKEFCISLCYALLWMKTSACNYAEDCTYICHSHLCWRMLKSLGSNLSSWET